MGYIATDTLDTQVCSPVTVKLSGDGAPFHRSSS